MSVAPPVLNEAADLVNLGAAMGDRISRLDLDKQSDRTLFRIMQTLVDQMRAETYLDLKAPPSLMAALNAVSQERKNRLDRIKSRVLQQ